MIKAYLSGGFYGTYKDIVREEFHDRSDFAFVDPEEQNSSSPRVPGYYVGDDLESIAASRVVLAVHTDYPFVYGMAAEVGFAVGLAYVRRLRTDTDLHEGEPEVIYVCLTGRVDSFLSGLARATFTDLRAACKFIKARYGTQGKGDGEEA